MKYYGLINELLKYYYDLLNGLIKSNLNNGLNK
jgi:hypothetical protein